MTTLSLASMLAEPAQRHPDKVALVQGDQRVTFAEAWRRARAVAAGLVARGIQPGDPVALLAPNTIEFVVGYYGILAAGAAVVPVPTLLQAPEAAYLLGASHARLLLQHPAMAGIGDQAAELAGLEVLTVDAVAEGHEPLDRQVTRQAEDVAVIFFTSGTTGRPKGALLTHLNMVMNATTVVLDLEMQPDDVVLASLPLFHVYGQSSVLNVAMRRASTLVLQPRFEPREALGLMVEHGVTVFAAVPTMYVFLVQAAEAGVPVPQLRFTSSGGAPLPLATLEAFERLFGVPVHEGYGLSETASTATVNQDEYGIKAGTVGHGSWGVDVEIAAEAPEDTIEILPPGERGEIVVRGHNVFAGYLDDPDATARTLIDGWLRTGDIGVKDEQGFVSVVDRKKDLIIRGGFNVYPREVEEVLMRHPAINQVAVIGLPDAERGEEVCAVVVPLSGATVDPDELVAWSREQLGSHKYPRRVEVVDELPMGPSQKVLKRELRARLS